MGAIETVDEAKVEAFLDQVVGEMGAMMTLLLANLGDRLGLFKELAERGPATPAELAQRAGVNERYATEWLLGLTSAGYLEFDRDTGRYSLPPEHALALANEGGPFFVGGALGMLAELVRPLDQLVESFRNGGGVPQDAYAPALWEGMERFTATWFENHLIQEWIPKMPDVQAALESGTTAADVGCGGGRALIKLAQAFPNSSFVGYDSFEGQVERARRNVELAGLSDRIRIEQLDASGGIPGTYDVITTFDVIHDAVDPRGLLREIRAALAPGGTYVMLEIKTEDDPHANVGPVAAMFYGVSVFYCMTTSLAHGGEGLGTHGMPEARVRELCLEAGFSSVRNVPSEDPFDNLFEIKA